MKRPEVEVLVQHPSHDARRLIGWPIGGIALGLHFFDRDKAQRGRVDRITPAGRGRSIVENMTEVRVTSGRAHLGALHVEGSIVPFVDALVRDGLGKRGTPRPGIKLVGRTEEGLSRDGIDIDAGLEVVPIFVAERSLGAAFAHDVVLIFLELGAQDRVTRHRLQVIECSAALFLFLSVADKKKTGRNREGGQQSQPER